MSYNRYLSLIGRSPDLGLADVAKKLKVGEGQARAWAARHVSEAGILNPGSGSREVAASHRIAEETGR
jgi:hypothetical protein